MRADEVAASIRDRVVRGHFRPGQHLSEPLLCEELNVSRNTLREVFRLLTKEGILVYHPNKGVFVATPDPKAITDVYRIRRIIECQAILAASPMHPAVEQMRHAVALAHEMRDKGEWLKVGSADILFHNAIIKLADSPRLTTFFSQVSAELRLVFGLFDNPRDLHAPFIDKNADILKSVEKGDTKAASEKLVAYLDYAEKFIMTAYDAHNSMQ